ncbi:hypothetical protein [Streptococcus pneumoniae]|uniref:hypothetical protein n=1 Tax=Streptococcus pneumoniae TaxID=1313 RepID=UPI000B597380|nr:hypothetical protein [Streptococcus pneumoniae]HET1644120.1 hypothetical protein [Streptococcus pneumoniae]HET1776844.1 hypothetical protein [Streptococcus pneumoniae]HET1780784.1 hypothetical protein [Streptococcus pneumoniae]HET1923962.1 hypothetical protein [Streptococcus pneumoniae]HET5696109.1 hypothetical protein [Streptococcus pneumoniae]
MKEIVVVLAISTKKDRGWIRVSTANNCWSDLGMHFDKSKFGAVLSAPGLYEVEVIDNSSFGQNAQYEAIQCRKLGTFAELIEIAKIK